MNSAYLHSVQEVIAELHDRGFYADCSPLMTDSRKVGPQSVFIAVPGAEFDPRTLADDLLEHGRCGLVLSEYDDQIAYQSAQVIPVKGLRGMLAELASAYYGNPSKSLKVIAVTGTNGKTTVTRWLAQTLNNLGHKAAVVGTLGYGEPDHLKEHSGLTTPDCVGLQRVLFELQQSRFEWVCLEASSIGLDQGRMSGVQLLAVGYTNLTHDHLDYHGSMSRYAEAKLKLAKWPGLKIAVINQDDSYGIEFGRIATEHGVRVTGFGEVKSAEWRLTALKAAPHGLSFKLNNLPMQTQLVGQFNAHNLALVIGLLAQCGAAPLNKLIQAAARVTPAPGRMQVIHSEPTVVVDYAHTPSALEKALLTLKPLADLSAQGRLLALFGCGGDRDPAKRPLMAGAGVQFADRVYFTSDNPRSENPDIIIEAMLAGVTPVQRDRVVVETDRVKAIELCLSEAKPCDVVLLAGKGHETTQKVGRDLFFHSDIACAEAFFQSGGT